MAVLQLRSVVESGQETLDNAVRDIALVDMDGGLFAYASSGADGGISAWKLEGGKTAHLADSQPFPDGLPMGQGDLTPVDVGGETRLVIGGDGSTGLAGYSLDADSGRIGALAPTALSGVAATFSTTTALAGEGAAMLFAADTGAGRIASFTVDADSCRSAAAVPGTSGVPPVMASLSHGGQDYLFTACPLSASVSSYRVGPDGAAMTLAGQTGAAWGLGIATPTALATAETPDGAYLLLGASGSSSISVMRVTARGGLVPTDHVIDTLDTRFAHIQSLQAVTVGDRAYVVAGGGDDGISLFTLLPGGKLMCLDTLADSDAASLADISALAAAHVGNEVQVLAASQSEAGLTQLAFSVADQGAEQLGGAGADTLTGGAGADLLAGGAGDDRLVGQGGDDILVGGAGSDTLTGGAGADTFVFAGDGGRDVVTDFTAGEDRLDLSQLPMFYDPARLQVETNGKGAVLDWFGQEIVLLSADRSALSRAEVLDAILAGPDRPALSTGLSLAGDSGADQLNGSGSGDALHGLAGADRLTGGSGADHLFGGLGADTLFGGPGSDTVQGGNGPDRAFLGLGDDLFSDTTQKGALAHDVVWGGGGNDTIRGGGGEDALHGQTGADHLFGQGGADHLFGDAGADRLFGGPGADTVFGGKGPDKSFLGAGDDLYRDSAQGGAAGADTVNGGAGSDQIAGGAGGDLLIGAAGDDRLDGQKGFDRLFGGGGADTLDGGPGHDVLTGGAGADTFVFAPHDGHDVVTDFVPGTDHLEFTEPGLSYAELAIHDSAAGAVVDYGDGSVLLHGLTAAELTPGDFLFS
ncbi:M10 family metallopeptidase C-terminal domain-containing protein [Acidimangrovimonas pyrenivorans]|uniref:M10 family metallopeptidase C-terminal domain-containing protein n=1 Tax=Acidimangrovimonas pyrenivorans TaxID=2030798 RepID=A0ABV7AMF7_9RHOB